MKVKTQHHAVQGVAIGKQAAANPAANGTNQAPVFNFYKQESDITESGNVNDFDAPEGEAIIYKNN